MESAIRAFAKFIAEMPARLRRIRRWGGYNELPPAEDETNAEHLLSTPWLGAAMLAIERESGRHHLNEFRILLECSLHDVGEDRIGDVTWVIKNDPRIKRDLRQAEDDYAHMRFDRFPGPIRDMFNDAYALESERGQTLDGDFFEAIERVGYMLFAIQQVEKGRLSFLKVFRHQHVPLLQLSERFESVRVFYEPYHAYVAEMLEKYPLPVQEEEGF